MQARRETLDAVGLWLQQSRETEPKHPAQAHMAALEHPASARAAEAGPTPASCATTLKRVLLTQIPTS